MFFDARALKSQDSAKVAGISKSRKVAEKVATSSLPESQLEQSVNPESRKVAKVAGGARANLKFANSQGNSQNEGLPESTLFQSVNPEIRKFAEFAEGESANSDSATYWRFRLTALDGGIIEISTTPHSTVAEIQRMYPAHHVDALFAPASVVCEISPPFYSLNGGEGGAYGLGLATPVAAPALTACCNECQRLNRSTVNPKGGLVDCEHLNGGRMQMTPLEPRNCTHFEAI